MATIWKPILILSIPIGVGTLITLAKNLKRKTTKIDEDKQFSSPDFISTYRNKIIVGENLDPHNFIESFEKLDMKQNIIIEITCCGGECALFYHVARYLLLKKKGISGKIFCYIPKYAYSSAWLLANCADIFIMNTGSMVSPFDPQIRSGMTEEYFPSVLAKTEFKTIDELRCEKLRYIERTTNNELNELLAQMEKIMLWSPERRKLIDENFNSGKYHHSRRFSLQDLRDSGYKVLNLL